MNSTLKSLLFWMSLAVVLVLIWQFSATLQSGGTEITYSEFLGRARKGEIAEVTFTGNSIRGSFTAGAEGQVRSFHTIVPHVAAVVPSTCQSTFPVRGSYEVTL